MYGGRFAAETGVTNHQKRGHSAVGSFKVDKRQICVAVWKLARFCIINNIILQLKSIAASQSLLHYLLKGRN